MARMGLVRSNVAQYGRHVTVWLVKEELGMVRQAGQGTIRKSAAGSGLARQARLGGAGQGMGRFGGAWLGRRGKARFGLDGTSEVWQAWLG